MPVGFGYAETCAMKRVTKVRSDSDVRIIAAGRGKTYKTLSMHRAAVLLNYGGS